MKIKVTQAEKVKLNRDTNVFSDILTKEISFFGKEFDAKQKELWYDELSVLLKSGINLKSALELLAETQKKEKLKQIMESMLLQLISGTSFSEIIKEQKSFTTYEYYAIKIGEQTGQLARIFSELSEFFKRKNDQRREVSSALTYPVIVLITSILVVGFMLKYVVPMFVDIFKQNNVVLPSVTQAIINFSDFISNYGWFLILMIIILIFGIYSVSKKRWFRKGSASFQMNIPIIGTYVKKIYLAQFTQAMALLASSKVPIVESLELVSEMISFYPLQSALKSTAKQVIKGGKLSSALTDHTIFDRKMIALMRVAEETNQTEYIFDRLKDQYSAQVKYQSQVIANVLNPLLTIIVGVLVGVILISMYLPMFQLSNVIK